MSSSDEPYGWQAFVERGGPVEVEILSPASEMAALLQRYRADVDEACRNTAEARHQGLLALAEQAVFVFQLERALERYQAGFEEASQVKAFRHLRVLKDQMLDALSASGLGVEDPLGQSFDAIADAVHVEGWRHCSDFASEEVAETLEPVITHRTTHTTLRLGRVIMGAPQQSAPSPPEISTDSSTIGDLT